LFSVLRVGVALLMVALAAPIEQPCLVRYGTRRSCKVGSDRALPLEPRQGVGANALENLALRRAQQALYCVGRIGVDRGDEISQLGSLGTTCDPEIERREDGDDRRR
jgi:hypothetical protein